MNLRDDEKQFADVINQLKQLNKVEAPSFFEADLKRKINSEKYSVKNSFWQKFLIPQRLIPTAAMVVSAVLIIFMVNTSPEEIEDPFSIDPKLREDLYQIEQSNQILKNQIPDNGKEKIKENPIKSSERSRTEVNEVPVEKKESTTGRLLSSESEPEKDMSELITTNETPAVETVIKDSVSDEDSFPLTDNIPGEGNENQYGITKQTLNFRQINLSQEQKTKVTELKERLEYQKTQKSE